MKKEKRNHQDVILCILIRFVEVKTVLLNGVVSGGAGSVYGGPATPQTHRSEHGWQQFIYYFVSRRKQSTSIRPHESIRSFP